MVLGRTGPSPTNLQDTTGDLYLDASFDYQILVYLILIIFAVAIIFCLLILITDCHNGSSSCTQGSLRPSWRSQGLSTGLRANWGGNTTSGAPLLWTAFGLHPREHPQPQRTTLEARGFWVCKPSGHGPLFQRLEDTQFPRRNPIFMRSNKPATSQRLHWHSTWETSGWTLDDQSPPLRTFQNPELCGHWAGLKCGAR